VAKSQQQKKLIYSLHQDEGTVEGHEQNKSYITKYYKPLLGPEEGNFTLDKT
jgi:hypothetical protein